MYLHIFNPNQNKWYSAPPLLYLCPNRCSTFKQCCFPFSRLLLILLTDQCAKLPPCSLSLCVIRALVPLGFPAGWLLQAFSMACFFWTSVREKPEKTWTVSRWRFQNTLNTRKIEENSSEILFSRYLFKILYNAFIGFIKLFDKLVSV